MIVTMVIYMFTIMMEVHHSGLILAEQVQKEKKVLKVLQVLQVRKVLKEHKVQQVLQDLKVLKVHKELRDLQDPQVRLDLQEPMHNYQLVQ